MPSRCPGPTTAAATPVPGSEPGATTRACPPLSSSTCLAGRPATRRKLQGGNGRTGRSVEQRRRQGADTRDAVAIVPRRAVSTISVFDVGQFARCRTTLFARHRHPAAGIAPPVPAHRRRPARSYRRPVGTPALRAAGCRARLGVAVLDRIMAGRDRASDPPQRWLELAAARLRLPAAGVEAAAGGYLGGAGHLAAEDQAGTAARARRRD